MFVAGATDVIAPETPILGTGHTVGTQYQYNTLRVVNDTAPRGCGYGNWACMANLCKVDLGTSAWRGWGGCWKTDGKFICYYECSTMRAVQ